MTAIIQPGGSVRDAEVIAAANEHGIAMVFTGQTAVPALDAGLTASELVLDGCWELARLVPLRLTG